MKSALERGLSWLKPFEDNRRSPHPIHETKKENIK